MPKKSKNAELHAALIRDVLAEKGMKEACPLCSNHNWEVFHPPGKECPKKPIEKT